MNEHLQSVEQIRVTLIDAALRFGPRVLVALAIVFAGVVAGRWAARAMERGFRRLHLDVTVRLLLVRTVRLLVFGLFAIMALQNLGIELLPLLAGIGLAGAGVALALQGVLTNVVAGLTIIFTRPFRVGEYISIAGEEGQVEVVSLFTTTLTHSDRSRVVIPNRKVVGEILHNYGNVRQLELTVGVAYDTDMDRALTAIADVLAANPRVLKEPAPVVQASVLADSAITIIVAPWTQVPDYVAARGEIYRGILEGFRDRGISVPFPQREVRLLEPEARSAMGAGGRLSETI